MFIDTFVKALYLQIIPLPLPTREQHGHLKKKEDAEKPAESHFTGIQYMYIFPLGTHVNSVCPCCVFVCNLLGETSPNAEMVSGERSVLSSVTERNQIN